MPGWMVFNVNIGTVSTTFSSAGVALVLIFLLLLGVAFLLPELLSFGRFLPNKLSCRTISSCHLLLCACQRTVLGAAAVDLAEGFTPPRGKQDTVTGVAAFFTTGFPFGVSAFDFFSLLFPMSKFRLVHLKR